MRVLIGVHGYPPEHNGGAERRAERTARGLAARGHEIAVVSARAGAHGVGEWSTQDGVPVLRTGLHAPDLHTNFRQEYDNPSTGALFARVLDEQQPDLVHVFSGYLLSGSVVRAAIDRAIPVVVSLTDYWWLCHQLNLLRTDGRRCPGPTPVGCARCRSESRRRFRVPGTMFPRLADHVWSAAAAIPGLGERIGIDEQIERRTSLLQTLNQADALIAPSYFLAGTYARHGFDQSKLHVWRQGVELHACPLRRAAPEVPTALPGQPMLRFGYIGQIKPHKGVHLLLDAWSTLRGAAPRSLRLYGSAAGAGAYARRIQRQVADGDNVEWPGEFFGADVWNVLAELDVLVVPSRFAENSPNAILEAQAVGLPVVGADIGGIGELIRHNENGLLFEADNSDDLGAKLQRLLDEPELLARFGQAARVFRSIDDELDQLVSLYSGLQPRYERQPSSSFA